MNNQISNLYINLKAIDMLVRILEIEHYNKTTPNPDAVYRNQINKITPYQLAWIDHLLQFGISAQLTITLPRKGVKTKIRNKSVTVYQISRNQYRSMDCYRELVKELEIIFTGSYNNWPRKAFNFKGALEQSDEPDLIWHIHLLVKDNSDNKICFLYRLCWSVQKLIYKYRFDDNVMDIQSIYNEKGICNYICKQIKNHRNLSRNEGSYIFDLVTMFRIKEKKIKPIKFHPIYKLKILIYFGLYLKVKGWFKAFIYNPIDKLLVVDKRHYRRQFEIDVLPYFDSLYFGI